MDQDLPIFSVTWWFAINLVLQCQLQKARDRYGGQYPGAVYILIERLRFLYMHQRVGVILFHVILITELFEMVQGQSVGVI